jgi:LL-diaminopimelate aminotransferase
MPTLNPLLSTLGAYPAEALHAEKRALLAAGREVFDFSVGDPLEPTDPRIVAAFQGAVPAVSQYPTIAGEDDGRAACAEWVARRFGVTLDPARELLPSAGSKEAIFHLPLAFLDPHGPRRRVLFGTPAYPVYERGTRFAGGEPWAVELRAEQGYRLEPWELPAAQLAETAVLWINYPHNPTGATVDRGYLARLAELCRRHDILLCSDECYVDLYLDGEPPPSLLEVAREGVLVFHSLSKRSGMTGYRAGFIAGDPQLIGPHQRAARQLRASPAPRLGARPPPPWPGADDAHVAARRRRLPMRRSASWSRASSAEVRARPASPCRGHHLPLAAHARRRRRPRRYAAELARARASSSAPALEPRPHPGQRGLCCAWPSCRPWPSAPRRSPAWRALPQETPAAAQELMHDRPDRARAPR